MKPILFNTDMVRAIQNDTKTVTRRVVKPQPPSETHPNLFVTPPYRTGDILYVRETWQNRPIGGYIYKADGENPCAKWRPSIHMPREAARIFLRVTDVRVERLRPISDTEIMKEGVTCPWNVDLTDAFRELWGSTIKKADRALYGWDANPWVWVIEFERTRKEEAF